MPSPSQSATAFHEPIDLADRTACVHCDMTLVHVSQLREECSARANAALPRQGDGMPVIERLNPVTEGDRRTETHARDCGKGRPAPGCPMYCRCWCHGITKHANGQERPDAR